MANFSFPVFEMDLPYEAIDDDPPTQDEDELSRRLVAITLHTTPVLMLARALFRTDPDVLAFVSRVGAGRPHVGDSFSASMQTAWDRDENGWTSRAMWRAADMGEWLGAVLR